MPSTNDKSEKLRWFHTHRIRIIIWTAAIVIPLTLILLAYVGSYNTYKKVYFDSESTEYIKNFDKLDDLETIDLDFEWITLKYPVFDDDDNVTTNGYYQFKFTFNNESSYNITNVVLTPVLQTNWIDQNSIGTAVSLIEDNTSNMLISYNFELPERTLIFIDVTDPILYLKVTINYVTGDQTFNIIKYVSIDLKDYYPNTVID